jgi:hypothetical protein
VDLTLLQNGI